MFEARNFESKIWQDPSTTAVLRLWDGTNGTLGLQVVHAPGIYLTAEQVSALRQACDDFLARNPVVPL